MRSLKNLLVIGGLIVFAVIGITTVRSIAAPAPWEQSWPSNTAQNQAQTTQKTLVKHPPQVQANAPLSEPDSTSSVASNSSPSNSQQTFALVKPGNSSTPSSAPPTVTNKTSSIQPVSSQTVAPTPGTTTPGNQKGGYWCRPMGSDFRPSYSWYSSNWNNGSESGTYGHR
ncbi:hypothetical protein Desaci_3939 [Desulfosporosinus acidiphilus SJ4]|uniref:Uncharacterized protein n=1 Tax=Desulfosporosinus acidiphilus (strain DSM 22704 / JCM 16185 / SJ4) TaxID=646529 RepID=I4DAI8_DESAJ|nr:hypothetical protein [Desulfosporosinus acidiphilus]AFM42812.1 hypothetical protein Desaci_3939 [Desulfosporosinus acidiphilus SJ4]